MTIYLIDIADCSSLGNWEYPYIDIILAEGIINGVIYGFLVWVVFSIARMIYEKLRGPKEMVVKASKFMKENNFDYFYAIYLFPDNVCGPKDFETILSLIKKGIFQPNKELK
ncbi:MAG: hypothetical protein ACFE9S_19275, partial [Candidatus Hermodarchaeota archaeon]